MELVSHCLIVSSKLQDRETINVPQMNKARCLVRVMLRLANVDTCTPRVHVHLLIAVQSVAEIEILRPAAETRRRPVAGTPRGGLDTGAGFLAQN